MKTTLGISCFYHDAAAALVRDGAIVAAAQEERFTRIKGDPSFPVSAISYCLEQADVTAAELDAVVFYDKPMLSFDRLVNSYFAVVPRGLKSWLTAMPEWISRKLHMRQVIREVVGCGPGTDILFTPHHLAHAASAYFPSPYDQAAILTIDGVGEWATASYGVGDGETVTVLKEMHFPDSLGLLYSALTYFCGFKVNTGEYKLMGLAPYGAPRFVATLKDRVVTVRDDGTVQLNLEYFGFLDSLEMTSARFADLFGGPPRTPESRITRREMDLAASIQAITNEAMLNMARHVHRQTGRRKLCLAGGVALNCVANGLILREGPFEDLWIQPAAGDAGGALGAALAVQHGCYGIKRPPLSGADRQQGSYLGPEFSEDETRAFLDGADIPYRRLEPGERPRVVAGALAAGRIVGFFTGRMEFGPRALGTRSILGDPRREDTQRIMNLKIKHRESFRPFAPSVLAEDAAEYFELDRPSPYMLLVAPVREERRCRVARDIPPEDDDLIRRVNQTRSDIPAVTHYDYSARIQTVHRETNALFHDVLQEFKGLTGCAVLVNTSYNVRGEPIVCTPKDAYRCFMRTDMDFLYVNGFWLDKKEQPARVEREDWKNVFTLD